MNQPMRKTGSGGLVYSTDSGRMCPLCRQPLTACQCKQQAAASTSRDGMAGDGKLRVSRETKGRGGKAVTVVRGLPLGAEALDALGKQLRTLCGCGGTVKDGVIELQGDHTERVMAHLKLADWTVLRSGG